MIVFKENGEVGFYLEDPQSDQCPALVIQTQQQASPNYSNELYRVYFVLGGESEVLLDNQFFKLSKGQMLAVSPAERAKFTKVSELLSLGFHHNFFCVRVKRTEVFCDGVVFNRLRGQPVITLNEFEERLLIDRFNEIRQIIMSPGPFAKERTIAALRCILLQAADNMMQMYDPKELEEDLAPHQPLSNLVLRFQDLLEENYMSNREVSFFTNELGCTFDTLNRRLKSELGLTVLQAINERVAIAARVELRLGRKSVKEVAFDLGFEDPLYFSRFFKKQFGASPTQYFQNPDLSN